jgi:hypothetical protein
VNGPEPEDPLSQSSTVDPAFFSSLDQEHGLKIPWDLIEEPTRSRIEMPHDAGVSWQVR